MTPLRVTFFSPTALEELNSVVSCEELRIKYQFCCRTKNRLVEKLPERELNLDVFWVHMRKLFKQRCETR